MPQYRDLIGSRFGMLTVVSIEKQSTGRRVLRCTCDCGNSHDVQRGNILAGRNTDCGCRRAEKIRLAKTKHGHSSVGWQSKTYQVWSAMRQRCENPRSKDFMNYGARGISVCLRWSSFENFLTDMGEKPDGFSIERKDVHAGYSAENCVWIPAKAQAVNKTTSRNVTIGGETKCFTEWCKHFGIKQAAASNRVNRGGWDDITALTKPVKLVK